MEQLNSPELQDRIMADVSGEFTTQFVQDLRSSKMDLMTELMLGKQTISVLDAQEMVANALQAAEQILLATWHEIHENGYLNIAD